MAFTGFIRFEDMMNKINLRFELGKGILPGSL